MSAFLNRALSRRAHVALILLIATAGVIAIAITMLAHSTSTSQPSVRSLTPGNGTSLFIRHRPHHPHSNAGYGLNS